MNKFVTMIHYSILYTVHQQVFCTFKLSKIAQKSSDDSKIGDLEKNGNSRISRQFERRQTLEMIENTTNWNVKHLSWTNCAPVYRLGQHYAKNQRNKK